MTEWNIFIKSSVGGWKMNRSESIRVGQNANISVDFFHTKKSKETVRTNFNIFLSLAENSRKNPTKKRFKKRQLEYKSVLGFGFLVLESLSATIKSAKENFQSYFATTVFIN